MLDKDLVPVTNRYAMFESSMKSLLHGYVVHFHYSSLALLLNQYTILI